ncbi:Peptidase [Rubrivivax sp. A210]|uniref:SapC family protein n=1 Tax=Rubrivivax sp. A210 TaxID=2772301 RepID=UPI0019183198|nr:SapC family protein [Rubrivivax sp. A210]CAD5369675.1 Peptidase [Rubrivivax sp. A210]
MINQNLHRQPIALDSAQHRQLKLKVPITDWSVAKNLNASFVAAAEFIDVCREFPIVFVKAGKEPDGSDAIAPLAVFGMAKDQNLYVSGERWRALYMPAILRFYPFCIARIDEQRFAICIDSAFNGVNTEEGQPLFAADGKPSELLADMQKQLETLETEIQRTRLVGKRLLELDLLREMRFDSTLPDGTKHTVDGFLTVDDAKLTALPDNVVGELHRSGLLGLVHLHWASLGNMRRLLDWHIERAAAAPAAPAAAA